jgi:hypothetical protein
VLYDRKAAAAQTPNRQLSDNQWAAIRAHLGLPRQARDDFDKIIAKHFKATESRECLKAWPAEDLDAAEQLWSDALTRKGIVMARNRGIQNVMPQDDLPGWTDVRPLSPRTLRRPRMGSTTIHPTLPATQFAELEAWRAAQPKPTPTIHDAVRILLDRALSADPIIKNLRGK